MDMYIFFRYMGVGLYTNSSTLESESFSNIFLSLSIDIAKHSV